MMDRLPSTQSKPTDLAIVVAAATFPGYGLGNEWQGSWAIRERLSAFGFAASPQFLASALKRMCDEDTPRLERRENRWGETEYRVSRWGRNEIGNKLAGLEVRQP